MDSKKNSGRKRKSTSPGKDVGKKKSSSKGKDVGKRKSSSKGKVPGTECETSPKSKRKLLSDDIATKEEKNNTVSKEKKNNGKNFQFICILILFLT